MKFSDKLRELRIQKGLSQSELGQEIGVSLKTISKYELDQALPRYRETYQKIADLFSVDIQYLLSEEHFVLDAAKNKISFQEAKRAQKVVEYLVMLFTGSELSDSDKDNLFDTLQHAYWEAKLNREVTINNVHMMNNQGYNQMNGMPVGHNSAMVNGHNMNMVNKPMYGQQSMSTQTFSGREDPYLDPAYIDLILHQRENPNAFLIGSQLNEYTALPRRSTKRQREEPAMDTNPEKRVRRRVSRKHKRKED